MRAQMMMGAAALLSVAGVTLVAVKTHNARELREVAAGVASSATDARQDGTPSEPEFEYRIPDDLLKPLGNPNHEVVWEEDAEIVDQLLREDDLAREIVRVLDEYELEAAETILSKVVHSKAVEIFNVMFQVGVFETVLLQPGEDVGTIRRSSRSIDGEMKFSSTRSARHPDGTVVYQFAEIYPREHPEISMLCDHILDIRRTLKERSAADAR